MAYRGLNKHIHPRNPYKIPIDIRELVKECDELRKYTVKSRNDKLTIDFKNPEALRLYTKTLLKKDFGLVVDLPPDRLIPTLTLRLNYLLWIEDLIKMFTHDEGKQIRGIDIGSGASCIYPLLGSKMNGWKFVATETDEKSIAFCRENIERNSLDNLITLIPSQGETVLRHVLEEKSDEEFDFCMCNPPFFSSVDEAEGKHKIDVVPSGAVNTASDNEMVTDGGEVEFVKKIVDDSVCLKEKIRFYTTMLGKKASMKVIKQFLIERNINNIVTTEFCQGKTMRWGIAWSFHEEVTLKEASLVKEDKKPTFKLTVPNTVLPYSKLGIAFKLKGLLTELSIDCTEKKTRKRWFEIRAKENTWIHQRRKRREQNREKTSEIQTNCSQALKRPCSDGDSPSPAKKPKLTDEKSDSLALEAKLVLQNCNDSIILEMYFVSGYLGRSGLYQLYQYLTNKLKRI